LNREKVTLNGVEFIGCTLWTDVPPHAQSVVASSIRDFDKIRVANGQVRLYMDAILQEHKKDLSFLTEALSIDSNAPRVVITHHAPSAQSVDDRYKQCEDASLLNYAYHTNLNNWAQDKILDLWVHGHTHNSFKYAFGPGVLCCNLVDIGLILTQVFRKMRWWTWEFFGNSERNLVLVIHLGEIQFKNTFNCKN